MKLDKIEVISCENIKDDLKRCMLVDNEGERLDIDNIKWIEITPNHQIHVTSQTNIFHFIAVNDKEHLSCKIEKEKMKRSPVNALYCM